MLEPEVAPVLEGYAAFYEVHEAVRMSLWVSGSTPSTKQVSILEPGRCDALLGRILPRQHRLIGDFRVDSQGEGTLVADIDNASLSETRTDTLLGHLIVVHDRKVRACGTIVRHRPR